MASPYPPRPTGGGKATMIAMSGAASVGGGGSGTSYSLSFTTDPATGTIGSVIDFSGTVLPSGQAVEFGLSTTSGSFTGGTFAGGTLGAATVSGTLWSDNITLNTAGTFYPFAEITGQATAVGTGIVVSASATTLTLTQIGSTPTGGLSGPNFAYGSSNMVTPIAHGSSINCSTTLASLTGSVASGACQVWYDTSATNTSSTAGTVAAGTLETSVNYSNGLFSFYNGTAPATAGTYYLKVQITVTGTGAGVYTFVSQAVTVT